MGGEATGELEGHGVRDLGWAALMAAVIGFVIWLGKIFNKPIKPTLMTEDELKETEEEFKDEVAGESAQDLADRLNDRYGLGNDPDERSRTGNAPRTGG